MILGNVCTGELARQCIGERVSIMQWPGDTLRSLLLSRTDISSHHGENVDSAGVLDLTRENAP